MKTTFELQMSRFQKSLNMWRMLAFNFLPVILFVGVSVYLFVIFFLASRDLGKPPEGGADNLMLFTMIYIFSGSFLYLLSFVVSKCFTSLRFFHFIRILPNKQMDSHICGRLEKRCLWMMAIGYNICVTLMAFTALGGITVCLIGIVSEEIYQQPLYWLNLTWYFLFVVIFIRTFPTKRKLEIIFENRFLKQI